LNFKRFQGHLSKIHIYFHVKSQGYFEIIKLLFGESVVIPP